MADDEGDVTRLLHQWQTGDREAESALFEMQPTALVNEAFLRLSRTKHLDWRDRRHFFAIAGRVMRRFLIDHARARPGLEFSGMETVPERMFAGKSQTDLVLEIDVLLDQLDQENRQRCSVVELRFFLGLTDEEAAEALSLSVHTLQREWYRARRWLFERLDAK